MNWKKEEDNNQSMKMFQRYTSVEESIGRTKNNVNEIFRQLKVFSSKKIKIVQVIF